MAKSIPKHRRQMGDKWATWTYFADALIATDVPSYLNIDKDPESRIMPIIQTWTTRAKGSTLPDDLRMMLKLAREYNIQISTPNPSK